MNEPTIPPMLNGFGTIVATGTAAAVSTVTKGSGSPAFPTTAFPDETVTITNNGTGTVIFYPFGGSTTGIAIALNATRTFNLGSTLATTPQIASGSTATATIEW